MKINGRLADRMSLLPSESGIAATVKGDDVSAVTGLNGSTPDAIDLSAAAVNLAEDEARRERLELIRQRLAEGSYNISGKDVADKMLSILKG